MKTMNLAQAPNYRNAIDPLRAECEAQIKKCVGAKLCSDYINPTSIKTNY
jgi:hypothetical protein